MDQLRIVIPIVRRRQHVIGGCIALFFDRFSLISLPSQQVTLAHRTLGSDVAVSFDEPQQSNVHHLFGSSPARAGASAALMTGSTRCQMRSTSHIHAYIHLTYKALQRACSQSFGRATPWWTLIFRAAARLDLCRSHGLFTGQSHAGQATLQRFAATSWCLPVYPILTCRCHGALCSS